MQKVFRGGKCFELAGANAPYALRLLTPLWDAIKKRIVELTYRTDPKDKEKSLKQKLLLSQSWKSDNFMGSNREKSNIAIVILENVTV